MFFRASTRNTAHSPNKYAFCEDTRRPVWIHFCVRHRVWRSSSWVTLHCLCARLRLGVVPTYYPVNSWPSLSSSCEESLFPCLHTHIVEGFKLPRAIGDVETRFWRFSQNFPWSETHHFRCRYTIFCKVQNFERKMVRKPRPRPAYSPFIRPLQFSTEPQNFSNFLKLWNLCRLWVETTIKKELCRFWATQCMWVT